MKKILIILLTLLLVGCSTNGDSNKNGGSNPDSDSNPDYNFINPVSDDKLFSYLNEETATLLKKANNNTDVDNTALNNVEKTMPSFSFTSYDGLTINLDDYFDKKVIFEVVSTSCSHCMTQAKTSNQSIVDSLDDIIFMQYFINGTNDSIDSFYKEIGESVPSDEIILLENEEFTEYIQNNFNFEATPTFYFFNDGNLSWDFVGTLTLDAFNNLYSVAFENALDINDLVDTNGESIFTLIRGVEEVENDLGEENYNKLVSLDNDGKTINLTLNNIGKTFDFYNQLDDESNFTSEVTWSNYVKGDVAIVMINDFDEEFLDTLNTFDNSNSDISLIVVNMSDDNNINMAKILNAPLVSIMNQVPEILNSGKLGTYPSCVFIKDSIITGIYSNVESLDKLQYAKDIFLGDNSIALIK